MYRKMDSVELRSQQIAALAFQIDVLEGLLAEGPGPFFGGDAITSADGALFPTFVFFDFMLPQFFGWQLFGPTRPKLSTWWAAVNEDPEAAKV